LTLFTWPVRVYYEDTDAGGVVYYANYLKFYERARTEMLRDMGFQQDRLNIERQLIFVVRSVQVEYLKSARFNEQLQVSAEISQTKSASLVFTQQIIRESDLISTAMVRIACLDSETMRPKIIPKDLQLKFKS
jgi:acyl-CoA thioester hydrolase